MSESALVDELAAQFRDSPPCYVDAVVSGLLVYVKEQPPKEGVDRLQAWRDRIEICRSQIIATQRAAGASERAVDELLGRKTTTHADRKRAKKRADTIERNRELGAAVDSGRLTIDQLDAISDADAKTDGSAANDTDLHSRIEALPADAARKACDEFVKAQQDNDDLEARRRRQRERRDARRAETIDGMASLTLTGDDESVASMWAAIVDTADAMYRSDGGRDLPAGEHPRSGSQRLFDAAYEHLTKPGSGAGAAVRPVIVVRADKLAGESDTPAELIGSGPIPDSLLNELACGSDFVGMVFDSQGEVLWQGRRCRFPTKAQVLALIARDRGCVLCGADPQACQAHHLIPWSAPLKGKTDIDGLALLCGPCHRRLHERNHTLYRDGADDLWRTRPSTFEETPAAPPRGRSPDNAQRRRRTGSKFGYGPRPIPPVLSQ